MDSDYRTGRSQRAGQHTRRLSGGRLRWIDLRRGYILRLIKQFSKKNFEASLVPSPDGACFFITVNDSGTLGTIQVTFPS